MNSVNSRAAEGYRSTYTDLSASGGVLAAAAGSAGVVAPPSVKHTVFLQRLFVTITTAAAQTITFRDTTGTPLVFLIIPASAAVGTVYSIDYGARGLALPEGKSLDIAGTAGPAYTYVIEAYTRVVLPTYLQATTIDRTF